jgi:hypothetical protein
MMKIFQAPKEVKVEQPLTLSMDYMLKIFVENHCRIIDEPQNEILSSKEVVQVAKSKPNSEDCLLRIVQSFRRLQCRPESFDSWSKPILRIINEGEAAWVEIMKGGRCHVCRGTYQYPHLAWGCVEPYSSKAVKEFMNQPEHRKFKEKEYLRRKKNYEAKWGKPYPY